MNARRKSIAKRCWHGVATFLLAIAIVLPAGKEAQAQSPSDAPLRARFLLNFLRFTEWPSTASAPADAPPIEVCVLGMSDPFQGALGELQGSTAGGRKINVHGNVATEHAAACHLLYVPDSELRQVPGAREAIGKRPVLIVGESEAILDHGGMIALRSVDRHLAFVVKLSSARQAALNFSPQMLHAAAEVLP
ncbi:putative transmembrane protein [Burkholderiales bacterium]|nr:putative transmembrane protein [Burkholderiales bacterium]